MRDYEIMIILDPEVDDRQVEPLIDNYLKLVTQAKGKVVNVDYMGRRRFAYEIKKKAEGTYVVAYVEAEPDTVKELDRRFGIDERVLRAKVFRPEK
ncbi:MAG: 30S ribosomal protein S6 [Propionibacteriaceae bacterium]|jgi:small subunit ribosomal protein S6|nr:30S ribosomal protein S6 [Propionibacteriaceae bacterium]